MKTIHETFTDEEHGILKLKKGKLTWREFIMTLVTREDIMAYRKMGDKEEEQK